MSRKKKKIDAVLRKQMAADFLDTLEANEEMMGEGAAMAVTCEMFGLEWTEGHELLFDHPNARPIPTPSPNEARA